MSRRIVYALAALASFILLALIATRWAGHSFVRGFLGDMLAVVFLFLLVKACVDARSARIALGVFTFACVVETLQYLRLADALGLAQGGAARIVLGATFDPLDILAYAAGCVASCAIDSLLLARPAPESSS